MFMLAWFVASISKVNCDNSSLFHVKCLSLILSLLLPGGGGNSEGNKVALLEAS